MILQDLLTELRENILHDRSQRISGDADHLWSDATLVRYINEAQKRLAREALVIRDSTTDDCCKVTLVTGQDNYTLDNSVLQVLSARVTGDSADLPRAGHSAFNAYQTVDPYFFDPSQIYAIPAGKPLAWSTDETFAPDDYNSMDTMVMRIWPTPSADYNGTVVRLRVCRMPLEELTTRNLKATPEVPDAHHMDMLDWAAYLALRIVDHELGDNQAAERFKLSFEAHVKEARDQMMRKIFTPQQWGFGKNGFAWER